MKKIVKYLVLLLAFPGFFFTMKCIHDSMCAVTCYLDDSSYKADSKTIDVKLWAWEGESDGHCGDELRHVYWNYEIDGQDGRKLISISLSQCPLFQFKKALYATADDKPLRGFITLSIPYEMAENEIVEVIINDKIKQEVRREP